MQENSELRSTIRELCSTWDEALGRNAELSHENEYGQLEVLKELVQ